MNSIWADIESIKGRKMLEGEIEVEVVVIGAGMAGCLIAHQLQKAGKEVIVLEAKRIASGQTQNTTAKITSQHGLFYQTILKELGEEKNWQYAAANERAIKQFHQLIEEEKIDCDYEKTKAYLYAKEKQCLEEEVRAAQLAGIQASYVPAKELPIQFLSCIGAVRFENQAQFHPLKFISHISKKLRIYENTPVRKVENNIVFTPKGKVKAEKIVFACHFPFVNFPGLYFTKMHQERSYVLALENAMNVDGMYIGVEKHSFSFRNWGKYLLFGGEGHRTGENTMGGHYKVLEQKARELFPDCTIVRKWSAQDCVTIDQIPYIGNFASNQPNWYIATGFKKWGMTSSMVSAMLLTDMICGKKNSMADVFNPKRSIVGSLPEVLEEGKTAVQSITKRIFQVPKESIKELLPGHGGVAVFGGEKVGVYKDEKEKIYAVNIKCPHLGCQLEWNPDEKTWDCPCHGSRFDYRGNLLSNPAQNSLECCCSIK